VGWGLHSRWIRAKGDMRGRNEPPGISGARTGVSSFSTTESKGAEWATDVRFNTSLEFAALGREKCFTLARIF